MSCVHDCHRLRKEFPVLGGESSLAAMQSQQQKQELEKYTSTPIVDVASTLPKVMKMLLRKETAKKCGV